MVQVAQMQVVAKRMNTEALTVEAEALSHKYDSFPQGERQGDECQGVYKAWQVVRNELDERKEGLTTQEV